MKGEKGMGQKSEKRKWIYWYGVVKNGKKYVLTIAGRRNGEMFHTHGIIEKNTQKEALEICTALNEQIAKENKRLKKTGIDLDTYYKENFLF